MRLFAVRETTRSRYSFQPKIFSEIIRGETFRLYTEPPPTFLLSLSWPFRLGAEMAGLPMSQTVPSTPDHNRAVRELQVTSSQLEMDLADIQRRIEQRMVLLEHKGSGDNLVQEYALLEEDKFWKTEIEARLDEHMDEMLARRMLQQEKEDLKQRCVNSTPVRKDSEYAKQLYELEKEFEMATRLREDKDEESLKLAAKLQAEEEQEFEGKVTKTDYGAETSQKRCRQKKVRIITRLLNRIRGKSKGKENRRK